MSKDKTLWQRFKLSISKVGLFLKSNPFLTIILIAFIATGIHSFVYVNLMGNKASTPTHVQTATGRYPVATTGTGAQTAASDSGTAAADEGDSMADIKIMQDGSIRIVPSGADSSEATVVDTSNATTTVTGNKGTDSGSTDGDGAGTPEKGSTDGDGAENPEKGNSASTGDARGTVVPDSSANLIWLVGGAALLAVVIHAVRSRKKKKEEKASELPWGDKADADGDADGSETNGNPKQRKLPTPSKIYDAMGEYVIGQEEARKSMAVAVYNHYKRIMAGSKKAKKQSGGIELAKSNILLLGPTGSGKTLMAQTLARLLDVPFAIADATALTEAGYIGQDVESILTKLLNAADGDVKKAQLGIVYIDEIDKLAHTAPGSAGVRQRDVSGEGVQQALLKMLEGSEVEVPLSGNSGGFSLTKNKTTIDTTNILFICGGAFVGLDKIVKNRNTRHIGLGFTTELPDAEEEETNDELLDEVSPTDLYKFGLIPELVGRIPIIAHTNELQEADMIRILREPKNAILRQFEYMFEVEGTELRFEDGALNAIAKEAIEKGTGARGLRSICERILRDIMFELPDMEGVKAVVITEDTVVKRTDPVIIEKTDEPDGTEKVKQLMGGAAEKVKETAEALMKKDKETAKAAAEE